jgi:hypothetical protein
MNISKSALEYEARTTLKTRCAASFTETKINARVWVAELRRDEIAYFDWDEVPAVIDSSEPNTEQWDDEAYYAQ